MGHYQNLKICIQIEYVKILTENIMLGNEKEFKERHSFVHNHYYKTESI